MQSCARTIAPPLAGLLSAAGWLPAGRLPLKMIEVELRQQGQRDLPRRVVLWRQALPEQVLLILMAVVVPWADLMPAAVDQGLEEWLSTGLEGASWALVQKEARS